MLQNMLNTQDDENWAEIALDDTALQSLLDNPLEKPNTSKLRDGTQHEGFDNNMAETWIYPNNLPCRSYQMSIVQSALYRNTLVVLPTGLGKTFIAAVVMYNFYRWYPRGKVVFMAPTRPLVNQQIEACQKIMPFPKKDSIELTGKLQKSKRREIWKNKRVFFATPQVVQSDILGCRHQQGESVDESSFQEGDQTNKSDFTFDDIKLIVVDEAHKARGKYAYTEVAQALARRTKYFRVLALSATPGRTLDDVAEVCRNLLISHIEVRWETSIDVLPYIHKRTMNTVVVSMGDKIKEIREQLLVIVDPYLRQLTEAEVLSGSLTNINRNFLLYEQKRYRDRSFHMGRHPQHSAISSNFSICISIYHALELLERHGLRVFLNYFEEDEEGKNKFVLKMDPRLNNLVESLKKEVGPNPFEFAVAPMTNGKIGEIPKDLDFGHPKFEKTREYLLKHFESNKDSRAIVFCEYRESVMLIYRMLLQHVPLLQPRCFVGQGGTGSLRALTQKQQIQIMSDFRSGKSNILIATSIGEEGIDVGEVELIICFDISTSNPMRFVQRIGRTGRQKIGHVIMMVTEGREQQLLREVLSNKDQINKKLLKSSIVQQSLYKNAPRLVPTEFKPKCVQAFIKPPSDDDEIPATKSKKSANKKKITPKKSDQDLRKFFQKKPKEFDKEELEFFENDTNLTQAKVGLMTQQNIINKLDNMRNLFKDLQSPIATQTQKSVKNSQSKMESNSQCSIKSYFKDSSIKNKTNHPLNKMLNEKPNPLKHLANATIDLCNTEDDADDSNKTPTDIVNDKPSTNRIHPERMLKLKEFLKTTITTPEVLKRSEINDLSYHLRSKELSRQMKTLLLTMRAEYIKENVEQMNILNTLHDNATDSYTEEEKSIREINGIILDLFGGLEKLEKFLRDFELDKYKVECLNNGSDSESEEDNPQEFNNFQKKLDTILKGYSDGKIHDNYDWIQQRLKDTSFYKDKKKSEMQSNIQESMVYENFVEPDDENPINTFEDFPITESKYCSQFIEFNEPDIAFKSTPVQGSRVVNKDNILKKNCLLSRLCEETKEEHELGEEKNDRINNSTVSMAVQNTLLILEKKLKESSINPAKCAAPALKENVFKTNNKANEMFALETDYKATNDLEDFNVPDEDDLIMAVTEAELKFTQSTTTTTSIQDTNKTAEIANLMNNTKEDFSAPSLNSTPDIDLSSRHIEKVEKPTPPSTFKTPDELRFQKELDIDMEAFMDPFPEEQELMKSCMTRSSLKENLITKCNSAIVRESPDLFAEGHTRSPIKRPIPCKSSSLSSKLSTKLKMQMCQSSPNDEKPPDKTEKPNTVLTSPSTRLPTDKQKYERSPSLFDMYLKNTKGKSKLPKLATNSSTLTTSSNVCKSSKESPIALVSQQNDSLIVIRNRKAIASKRKIFDSDSEHEADDPKLKVSGIDPRVLHDDDSDVEEVAATQVPNEKSVFRQRRKRRRFNSFIEKEARVSGSDQSADETEHTADFYGYDSVVVRSDEDDPDQASTSHMQAMYLRSLKSPQQRRGTFKIPAPRVYNDHSHIFSQAVLPEDKYSQYVPDSFIVAEEDSATNDNTEMSICPLERAEKILKEERRAKKLMFLEGKCNRRKPKNKTKFQIIVESSEDDDFE